MLLVCRVCLSTNRRMKIIANTMLQAMFEKLTEKKLFNGMGMPECVCYICHLQLQRCCKFVNQSQKADNFLRQLINHGIKITKKNVASKSNSIGNATDTLTISSTIFVSVPKDFCDNESSKIIVKTEPENIVKTNIENTGETADIATNKLDIFHEHMSYDSADENSDTPLVQTKREGTKSFPYCVAINPEQPDLNKQFGDLAKSLITDKSTLTHGLKKVSIRYAVRGPKQAVAESRNNEKTSKNNKSALKNIEKHTHEQKGPFRCDKCLKVYKQKAYLKKHIRIHTGEKPYSCIKCMETFIDSTSLKLHVKIHNGDAPYICKTCFRSFKKKPHLIEHHRTHTGEKPHACQHCPSKFAHQGALKRHVRTHTGEKPYMCKICSRKFTQISNLKKHSRICNIEKSKSVCGQCSERI